MTQSNLHLKYWKNVVVNPATNTPGFSKALYAPLISWLSLLKVSRFIFFSFLVFSASLYSAEDEWEGVDKIIAIGDIHGDYENYFSTLTEAGLINRRGNWIAGETHFVQLGDIPDRGPDTYKIIQHLQTLERQAERRGGMVHSLIGNHEFMNMVGDLRYVHPGEYEALKGRNAARLQDNYYSLVVQDLMSREEPPVIDEDFKTQWYQDYPLGYVEHRQAWSPEGEFGQWVKEHNAVIKINNILFMHGGIGPSLLNMSIRQINDQVRAEITSTSFVENSVAESDDSPLWYRGLVLNDEQIENAHLEAVLSTYNVDHIVLGHTPQLGVITPRFAGKVLITDTGISQYYGAHKASLLIDGGSFFALQNGEKITLPSQEEEIIPYFQKLLSLKPEHQPIESYLNNLLMPMANRENQGTIETNAEPPSN